MVERRPTLETDAFGNWQITTDTVMEWMTSPASPTPSQEEALAAELRGDWFADATAGMPPTKRQAIAETFGLEYLL